jgi:hypothetical protein
LTTAINGRFPAKRDASRALWLNAAASISTQGSLLSVGITHLSLIQRSSRDETSLFATSALTAITVIVE